MNDPVVYQDENTPVRSDRKIFDEIRENRGGLKTSRRKSSRKALGDISNQQALTRPGKEHENLMKTISGRETADDDVEDTEKPVGISGVEQEKRRFSRIKKEADIYADRVVERARSTLPPPTLELVNLQEIIDEICEDKIQGTKRGSVDNYHQSHQFHDIIHQYDKDSPRSDLSDSDTETDALEMYNL